MSRLQHARQRVVPCLVPVGVLVLSVGLASSAAAASSKKSSRSLPIEKVTQLSPVQPASLLSPPTPVTVTDDGSLTFSTTQPHAHWTSSSHPTAAIVDYQYLIQQRSSRNPVIVPWSSIGLATEMTRTGLKLRDKMYYYIGVRAKADNGLWSLVSYSDGIQVRVDTTPPTGTIIINGGAAFTNNEQVTLTLTMIDQDRVGTGLGAQMAFSNDQVT